jgi:hypothetical protein
MSGSLDVLLRLRSENSLFKLPRESLPLRYFSDLLLSSHQRAQPLAKTFHSQKTLGFKIIPNRRTIDPRLNEFTIPLLRDSLTVSEMA